MPTVLPHKQGCGVLIFVGLRLRLQDVMCDILIVYFRMHGEKIEILLIKGAHQCTIVYKHDLQELHIGRNRVLTYKAQCTIME